MSYTFSMTELSTYLSANRYPGRGIVVGMTERSQRFFAYFIMGRSTNSRNRIFHVDGTSLSTQPYDSALVKDPSLIIYRAVCLDGLHTIVANGDHADTILLAHDLTKGMDKRTFEPDAPNFTPRIAALISQDFQMGILRRTSDGTCAHDYYRYAFKHGIARIIHTYESDGNPLPSFSGEPREVTVNGTLEEIAKNIWASLDPNNKISLVVRTIEPFAQYVFNKQLGD